MQYNEQENRENIDKILVWINSFNQSQKQYYTLQQVVERNPIPNLLKCIDEDYFSNLNFTEDLDYEKYFLLLDKYLQNHFGKKIKRKAKFQLIVNQCLMSLLQIVLYISVHCKKKQEFIQKILDLPNECQINLMNLIQESQQKLENVMQVKQILQKVEELEMQNDYLRQQINTEKQKNNQINQRFTYLMNYCHSIQKQYEDLRREKDQTLKQLNISSINSYIQLYKSLESENTDLFKSYKDLQHRFSKLDQLKNQLKSKILEDADVINDLNDEIQRYKTVCKNLRLNSSNSFEKSCLFEVQQFEQKVLKQNKTFFNLESTKSVYFDSNKKNLFFQEDQILKLRHEIKQISSKYQNLIQIHQIYKKQALKAQQQNLYLKRIVRSLKSQIEQLKQIHLSFKKMIK